MFFDEMILQNIKTPKVIGFVLNILIDFKYKLYNSQLIFSDTYWAVTFRHVNEKVNYWLAIENEVCLYRLNMSYDKLDQKTKVATGFINILKYLNINLSEENLEEKLFELL